VHLAIPEAFERKVDKIIQNDFDVAICKKSDILGHVCRGISRVSWLLEYGSISTFLLLPKSHQGPKICTAHV